MIHPALIAESERNRRIRDAERREVAEIPIVDRIRPAIGVVPTLEEERRRVVTVQIWTP